MTLANTFTGATARYAISSDFCRIFRQDMNRLYLLSLMLTGDHDKAEKCFASGLEDSVKANQVFLEWARSWARRIIIRNAIGMIHPTPECGGASFSAEPSREAIELEKHASIAAILALPAFERFVFVMSVLERYSDQDCSILLGCSRRDIVRAKAKAAEHISALAESRAPYAGSVAHEFAQPYWLPQSV